MNYDNRVNEIKPLGQEILKEVVREGEAMLAAQLTVATAADQRAMTFAGLLIAAATAATGGVVALVLSSEPNWEAALIGALYALAAITAAGLAIWSARPAEFSFPGNEPASWHPAQWHTGIGGPHDVNQAHTEQAMTLQSQIGKNKKTLARNALWMKRAVTVGFLSTALAALAIVIWGAYQWSRPTKTDSKALVPIVRVVCQSGSAYKPVAVKSNVKKMVRSQHNPPVSQATAAKRAVIDPRLPDEPVCKPSHPTTAG